MTGMVVTLCLGLVALQDESAQSDQTDEVVDRFAWLTVPAKVSTRETRWCHDFDGALSEAARRNVPVMVVIADGFSPGFATAWPRTIDTSTFTTLSHEAIVVPAVLGDLGRDERKVDGEVVSTCVLFGGSVERRQKNYEQLSQRFCRSEYWQPMYLLLEPTNEEWTRREGEKLSAQDVREEVIDLRERLGTSRSSAEDRAFRAKLRKLIDGRRREGRGQVIERCMKWPGGVTTGMRADLDRAGQCLLDEGQEELDALLRDLRDPAREGDARKALRRLAREYSAWPVGKRAEAAIATDKLSVR